MPKQLTASPPSRPSPGSSRTMPHSMWRAMGRPPSWWGGGASTSTSTSCCPPPPFVLASLLACRPVNADFELASAFGRDPLCLYQGPKGTRPSRIDGPLVDMRLAALLHAAELLPRRAIPGHTPVRFGLHLKGASLGAGEVHPPQAR